MNAVVSQCCGGPVIVWARGWLRKVCRCGDCGERCRIDVLRGYEEEGL